MSAMYTGHITQTDPMLVDSWEREDGLKVYVVQDDQAGDPYTEYDQASVHVQLDSYYRGGDGGLFSAPWDRWQDHELTCRYMRMFRDVAVIDYTTGRAGTDYFYITHETVKREMLPRPVATLDAEREQWQQWTEGQVYGVIVNNPETGEEASLWGIYDATPAQEYVHGAAEDLASEVNGDE